MESVFKVFSTYNTEQFRGGNNNEGKIVESFDPVSHTSRQLPLYITGSALKLFKIHIKCLKLMVPLSTMYREN